MTDPRHAPYHAFVWPLFWPWLWLNLRRLEAWQEETGRTVLLRIDRFGNIYVTAMADAPNPQRYQYTAPVIPAWDRSSRWRDLPENLLRGLLAIPGFFTASNALASCALGSGLTRPFPDTS